MLATVLAISFFIAMGIALSRYELTRSKRQRREKLRQRARRCV